ncbi:universal stress protein [Streptomyces sp. NPDC093224]|uniref:universal stress protein n=1 Tax=Streptomyces sp. NPDC093224 TaxID=3155198 RepID=UPI00343FF1FE
MDTTPRTSENGPVTVGVDGSDAARAAALWAAGEAVRRDRSLHVVHGGDTDGRNLYLTAATLDGIRGAGRELLAATARAVTAEHPGLDVTTEYSSADPVTSLYRAGGLYGTVVVGHRGLGGFHSLLLGSVGLGIAAIARTPVVVVRGVGEGEERGAVVAAVRDGNDLVCARHAARGAELRKATLSLRHVWNVLESVGNVIPMLDAMAGLAGEHERVLTSLTDTVHEEFPGLTVEGEADKSVSVAGVLVEASRGADLLVMGGRRAPGRLGLGRNLGRVTHTLLHHAHCPVLLVPRTTAGDAAGPP